MRGQVDPREKASQSKIKAQFATQRLDQRRREVERLARDTARIQVGVDGLELYSSDKIRPTVRLLTSCGKLRAWNQNIRRNSGKRWCELLKNDHARGFRVDVETDSTIEMDAGQTQEARTEFLQSAGNFLNNALQVMQAART